MIRGFDRNYITYEQQTSKIKGKIDFGESLKKNLFKNAKAHCVFDEFSHNVLHNQILKYTLRTLLRYEKLDPKISNEISGIYKYFLEIDVIQIQKKHFNRVQLNSNNFFYDFLLKICEIIYDFAFIDEKDGKLKFRDFLRDEKKMAILFEEFVRNFYKAELPKFYPEVKVGREDIFWDVKDDFMPKMQTDISIEFQDRKMIIDTKYYKEAMNKYFDKEKFRTQNIYQLHAYLRNVEKKGGLNLNCDGMLLYPTVDKVIYKDGRMAEHKVYFNTINLNQNWKDISKDLIELVNIL